MGWVTAIWLAAALAAVIVLVALLASDIRVEATLKREQSDDTIRICLTALYGLVKRQMVIYALTWGDGGVKVIWRVEKGKGIDAEDSGTAARGNGPAGQADAGSRQPAPPHLRPARPDAKQHRTAVIDMKKAKKSYRKFIMMLKATREMKEWLSDTARHIRCPELVWVTRIGLGDAADSALAAGVVWGIKAPLVGWFTHHIRMQSMPQLSVVPLFNEMHFETEFSGTLSIRLANALAAVLHLVWRALCVSGDLRRWWKVLKGKRSENRRKKREGKERLAGEA